MEKEEKFWSLARRRWIYSIAAALVPVAVTFGLFTDEQAAPLLGLAAALLGTTGLALMNPTED